MNDSPMMQRQSDAHASRAWMIIAVVLAVGCSDPSEASNGQTGSRAGSAGSSAGATTGGAAGTTGGGRVTGGGGGASGGAGEAGLGSGGSAPGGGGAGGSAEAGDGGNDGSVVAIDAAASGSGGNDAGPAPGRDGSTSSDGGVGSESDLLAAAPLHQYQLLDPCDLTSYKIEASPGAVCPQTTAVKNQHVSLKFAGDSALTYQVTLRVRAIIEHYWYAGGKLDPVSKTFYTGGLPTVGGYSSACKNTANTLPFKLPTEISPSDNCFNGFNVFAMTVSAPKEHYYLNYTTDKASDRPPHAVYNDDYTVTIPIQGQATIEFYIVGSDEHQCYNHKTIVSGVTLPASPYIGEFVQFDVLKVTH